MRAKDQVRNQISEKLSDLSLFLRQREKLPRLFKSVVNLKRLEIHGYDILAKKIIKISGLELRTKAVRSPARSIPDDLPLSRGIESISIEDVALDGNLHLLQKLSHLRKLKIENCQNRAILADIRHLRTLAVLSLPSNEIERISEVCSEAVPIRILDLSDNNIAEIDTVVPKCEVLLLHNNPFRSFPSKLLSYDSVSSLSLDYFPKMFSSPETKQFVRRFRWLLAAQNLSDVLRFPSLAKPSCLYLNARVGIFLREDVRPLSTALGLSLVDLGIGGLRAARDTFTNLDCMVFSDDATNDIRDLLSGSKSTSQVTYIDEARLLCEVIERNKNLKELRLAPSVASRQYTLEQELILIGAEISVLRSRIRAAVARHARKPRPKEKEKGTMAPTKKRNAGKQHGLVVFISYAKESVRHEHWVRRVADNLIVNGLNVILDQYELHPGDDLRVFMQESVKTATHVICVCTPKYVRKANDREAGVGEETYHLTASFFQIYRGNKVFIPIVRKANPGSMSLVPDYLRNLSYIDFRAAGQFKRNMEQLIRRIYGKYALVKPKKGHMPKLPSNAGQRGP